jgi:hypothetical protein
MRQKGEWMMSHVTATCLASTALAGFLALAIQGTAQAAPNDMSSDQYGTRQRGHTMMGTRGQHVVGKRGQDGTGKQMTRAATERRDARFVQRRTLTGERANARFATQRRGFVGERAETGVGVDRTGVAAREGIGVTGDRGFVGENERQGVIVGQPNTAPVYTNPPVVRSGSYGYNGWGPDYYGYSGWGPNPVGAAVGGALDVATLGLLNPNNYGPFYNGYYGPAHHGYYAPAYGYPAPGW